MSHTILTASETPAANTRKQRAPKPSDALINGASLRGRESGCDSDGGLLSPQLTCLQSSHRNCVLDICQKCTYFSLFFIPSQGDQPYFPEMSFLLH